MANDERTPPKHTWRPETELVHAGITRSQWNETAEALFLTQGYVYKSAEQAEARFKGEDPGHQYTRYSNPTISMFEDRLKIFEGAEECRATATGMAAVTASILSYVKTGDHIVAARAMFGSCRNVIETICARFGITSTLIDGKDLDAWRAAIRPNTKMFFFETPSNPNLELVDIEGVSKIGREHGIITIVDNVFATPILQRPLALGADVVVYSATKHIDGQGRCLGGAVLGSTEFMIKYVQDWLRQTGPSLGPVQRLGLVEEPGDDAGPRPGAMRVRRQDRRSSRRRQKRNARHLSGPRRPSAGCAGRKANARWRPDDRVRG